MTPILIAIFFPILKLIGKLPLPIRRSLGKLIGDLARLGGVRKSVVIRNLELAFPEFTDTKRKQILRQHYQTIGAVFLDECALLSMTKEQVKQWVKFPDDELLSNSSSMIVCAPHLAASCIGGLRIATILGNRAIFNYTPLHNKFWDHFYGKVRMLFDTTGIKTTDPNAVRACAKRLKLGGLVFYLPDVDIKNRKSMIFAPFLGVKHTVTYTTIPRLATMSGATVSLYITFMTQDGYQAKLTKLPNFPSNDPVADASTLSKLIAEQVQLQPSQYYWLHRRFKTAPADIADRYA